MSALSINKIQIGTRHRREMGDIASLAASMGELGLLQPVVVRDQSDPFQIQSLLQSVKAK
jgi:ParB-like chromosome segregation protein Spo0J